MTGELQQAKVVAAAAWRDGRADEGDGGVQNVKGPESLRQSARLGARGGCKSLIARRVQWQPQPLLCGAYHWGSRLGAYTGPGAPGGVKVSVAGSYPGTGERGGGFRQRSP